MERLERELADIRELNRTTKTSEAEARLRRLLATLPRHELLKAEHSVRQVINEFLPKRRRSLTAALTDATARRTTPSVSTAQGMHPGVSPPQRIVAQQAVQSVASSIAKQEALPMGVRQFEVTLAHSIPTAKSALSTHVRTLAASTLRAVNVECDDATDPVEQIGDGSRPADRRRVLASCVARCLATHRELYNDTQFRITAVKLLDQTWEHDVYASLGIDKGTQTYEKWAKIDDAVNRLVRELSELRTSCPSLTGFPSLRQELRKLLNSTMARAVVWPIVHRDLLTGRLDEALAAVAEYGAAQGGAVFEARTRALDTLQDYAARLGEAESTFASDVLAAIATSLTGLVEAHFKASPLSKPASMSIKPTSKKYPLDLVGTECRFGVIVECCGPGHAFDVELEFLPGEGLSALAGMQYLGNMQPGQVVGDIGLACRIDVPMHAGTIKGRLRWTNHDQGNSEHQFSFTVEAQPAGVNWNELAAEDPYSLEPVTEERELVGRSETLHQLTAKLTAKSLGSFLVFGQKRVGKTSLVRTLESHLKKRGGSSPQIVYLDGGDYVHPDATETIERLGRRICEEVKRSDRRFHSLTIPSFDGALSPIDDFLRSVLEIVPEYRVVFVLDEFDELPFETYRRGPVGDSFFLTLRSISAKPAFGFILVGSEKMEFILSTQGDSLNKFQVLRIDYFDREKHWPDFQALIRQPTQAWLEISDDALVALYNATAGNPFFAKLLCNELFRLVLKRRDAHVTAPEVREAVRRVLATAGSNQFAHFWEDGIFAETGNQVEERSILRRHVLLALAENLRRHDIVKRNQIVDAAKAHGLIEHEVDDELVTFARRKVLERVGDGYRCKVGLFNDWLRDRGVHEILTTFTDRTALLARKEREERERIPEAEIQLLADKWGPYKAQPIGPESIRGWLAQFGGVTEQRLLFNLLGKLRFYSGASVRAKMHEAHSIVERRLAELEVPLRLGARQRKRRDILVSHLGGVAKSGVRYGQLYADENQLFADSVIERDRIGRAIRALTDTRALVFVDDFIGTGQSALEAFRALATTEGEILQSDRLVLVYVVVCGFEAGRARLETELELLRLPVIVHICEPMTEADRCFSENSEVLPDKNTRLKTRDLVESYGRRLLPAAPLGFGDGQALVVFEWNCPNNTLPILWSQHADWRPLFKRQ